jgi:predicted transcriptional regulator
MTKTESLLAALQNGEEFTVAQIRARFGTGNPHEAIRSLREKGFAIYLNDRKNSKGEVVTKYRLGKPSRKMVAAAYAVLGGSVFDSRAA